MLKEISHIHSEVYVAGELKHGTIALIDEGTLIVTLATQEHLFDKMLNFFYSQKYTFSGTNDHGGFFAALCRLYIIRRRL